MFTSTHPSAIPHRSISPAFNQQIGYHQVVPDIHNRGIGWSPGYPSGMISNNPQFSVVQNSAAAAGGGLSPVIQPSIGHSGPQLRSVTPPKIIPQINSLTPPPSRTTVAAPVQMRSTTPPATFAQTTPVIFQTQPTGGSIPPQPINYSAGIRTVTPPRTGETGSYRPRLNNEPRQSILPLLTPTATYQSQVSKKSSAGVCCQPRTPPSFLNAEYKPAIVPHAQGEVYGGSVRPSKITTTIREIGGNPVSQLQNESCTMRSQMCELEQRIRILERRLKDATNAPPEAIYVPSPNRTGVWSTEKYPQSVGGLVLEQTAGETLSHSKNYGRSDSASPSSSPSNRFEWRIQDIINKMNTFQPGEFLHSTDFSYQQRSGYQLRFFPNEEGTQGCRFGVWCPSHAPRNRVRLFLGPATNSEREWLREIVEGVRFCSIEFSKEDAQVCSCGSSLVVGVEFLDQGFEP